MPSLVCDLSLKRENKMSTVVDENVLSHLLSLMKRIDSRMDTISEEIRTFNSALESLIGLRMQVERDAKSHVAKEIIEVAINKDIKTLKETALSAWAPLPPEQRFVIEKSIMDGD